VETHLSDVVAQSNYVTSVKCLYNYLSWNNVCLLGTKETEFQNICCFMEG